MAVIALKLYGCPLVDNSNTRKVKVPREEIQQDIQSSGSSIMSRTWKVLINVCRSGPWDIRLNTLETVCKAVYWLVTTLSFFSPFSYLHIHTEQTMNNTLIKIIQFINIFPESWLPGWQLSQLSLHLQVQPAVLTQLHFVLFHSPSSTCTLCFTVKTPGIWVSQ